MASQRERDRRFFYFFAVMCCSIGAFAQKTACRIDYEDQNQIDYEMPSRIGVAGFITDPSSAQVPKACVAIFTEEGHRFILGRTSDAKGQFHLPLLRNGTYRLVVRAEGFGVANVKFKKVFETYGDAILHVHMLGLGIDRTSYIDSK